MDTEKENALMPLTFAKPGHTGVIQRILGKDEARRHLESLGFVVGAAVSVVAERGGNLILQIRHRVAHLNCLSFFRISHTITNLRRGKHDEEPGTGKAG